MFDLAQLNETLHPDHLDSFTDQCPSDILILLIMTHEMQEDLLYHYQKSFYCDILKNMTD